MTPPAVGKTAWPSRTRSAKPRSQRGVATLVIVMLLFFVVSLTAAYTARNLIFEQRTSTNLYRGTQSFEAAEAGLEWALARLNGGRVDAACQATADPTFNTFRERYLTVDPVSGDVRRMLRAPFAIASPQSFRWAACVFDGSDWVCDCPTDALPALTNNTTGPGPYPAFGVRFSNQAARPGLTRIEVNGCNSADLDCLTNIRPEAQETVVCRSTVCSLVALFSATTSPPLATVTAKGQIVASAASAVITNADVASGARTLRAGGAVAVGATLRSAPGAPGPLSVLANDSALAGLPNADTDDCVLCLAVATFNVPPSVHRQQPDVVEIDCAAACDATAINTLLASRPHSAVVVRGAGGLRLDTAGQNIGSAAQPVLLRVEGPFEMSADAAVTGLVYAGQATLSAGQLMGALVSGSDATVQGTAELTYDAVVLATLQRARGSFVRVPNGWRDLP